MPWKVSHTVNERMQFVARLQSGEKMTDLCREFGISRKTGYKFRDRFLKDGPTGLLDESRRPVSSPNQTPPQVRELLLAAKKEKPHFGASKIRGFLLIKDPSLELPSRYTIQSIFAKEGLVTTRGKRRDRPKSAGCYQKSLAKSESPNELWCADFKGQFRLGNGRYCYPLTVTDHFSRYLLGCDGLEDTKGTGAKSAFRAVFEEFGLPDAMRTDNGSPFASGGLFGLSQLSVWWMRLGIELQRIEPGHPEQNGRHERMHLTLKQQTTRPAGRGFLEQQQRFDEFRLEFNTERPHEALKMKPPKAVYKKSKRPFPKELPELKYPLHDLTAEVYPNGVVAIKKGRLKFHLSQALSGEAIGLREDDVGRWTVSFMNLDLGTFDQKAGKFCPADQPAPSGG